MALNRKKLAALTAFNRKNSGVSGVEPEKIAALTPLNRETAALTALNRNNSGVNSI